MTVSNFVHAQLEPYVPMLVRLIRIITIAFATSTFFLTIEIQPARALENMTIEVKPGQTIRDIAAVHLQDPNLWKTILSFNDIEDAATVAPGRKLRIPVALVRRANQRRDAALAEIQRATEAGAKVFARQLIGAAVMLYDSALSSRKANEWERSAQEAEAAEQKARDAFAEAMSKRKAKVKAKRGNASEVSVSSSNRSATFVMLMLMYVLV